jgi:hypothetical protein
MNPMADSLIARTLRRGMVSRLVLILSGVTFALVIVEAGMRVFGISWPVFDDYDPWRGVRLTPGMKGWYTNEGNAYLEVNSLGYRDIDHATAKPPGVYRIAVLGDSFTEARQVDLQKTFWKLLEHALNGIEAPHGRQIEVLNFGVGGYGTSQELLTLEMDALRFSPDLVLLAFFSGNDFVNNSKVLSDRIRGESFRPFHELRNGQLVLDTSFRDSIPRIVVKRSIYFAVHHFRLLELLNRVRHILENQALQGGSDGRSAPPPSLEVGTYEGSFVPPRDPEWERAWELTEALLVAMNARTSRAGARFMVVILGQPIQVDPAAKRRESLAQSLGVEDLFYSERRLRSLGDRAAFPVISLAETMQKRADETGIHLHGFKNTVLGTGHWNEQGHAMAAEIISRELVKRGLLR